MKTKTVIFLFMAVSLALSNTLAQTKMKSYKAGHAFELNLPDYMTKTSGLNDAAIIQFNNSVKDIAGFIIIDTKEDLELVEMKFTSVTEFYDFFIKDFIIDQKDRKISEPILKTIGDYNYIECDASYYDEESKIEIYYFIGIVETKTTFYKLLCFGGIVSKEKYKADFQNILYSIKD
jgi:hypothetical protein